MCKCLRVRMMIMKSEILGTFSSVHPATDSRNFSSPARDQRVPDEHIFGQSIVIISAATSVQMHSSVVASEDLRLRELQHQTSVSSLRARSMPVNGPPWLQNMNVIHGHKSLPFGSSCTSTTCCGPHGPHETHRLFFLQLQAAFVQAQ